MEVNRESVEGNKDVISFLEKELEELDQVVDYFRNDGAVGDPARHKHSRVDEAISELKEGRVEKAKEVLNDIIAQKEEFLETLRSLPGTENRKGKMQGTNDEIEKLKKMRQSLEGSTTSDKEGEMRKNISRR